MAQDACKFQFSALYFIRWHWKITSSTKIFRPKIQGKILITRLQQQQKMDAQMV